MGSGTSRVRRGGGVFQKWQRDSSDWSLNPTTSLTLDSNHTMTAMYTAPPSVQVTIQTSPSGHSFAVDGTVFTNTQTFAWTPGSAHTIEAMSPQVGNSGTRYVWTGWNDNGAVTHVVVQYLRQLTLQRFLRSSYSQSILAWAGPFYRHRTGLTLGKL